jgi:hypothetical protein
MKRRTKRLHYGLSLLTAGAALFSAIAPAQAADKKPNIVIIWGDDIGQSDISAYSMGLMGFKTPNIDRVAKEDRCYLAKGSKRAYIVFKRWHRQSGRVCDLSCTGIGQVSSGSATGPQRM